MGKQTVRKEPRRKRWTKKQYDRMEKLGWFTGETVEYVDGKIFVLNPVGPQYEPGVDRQRKKWTKAHYYRMGELGWFGREKAELLEGDIVVYSPQNWPHTRAAVRVQRALQASRWTGIWIRMQLPLDLGQVTEPEPDISVIAGSFVDFEAHPKTALLIVEVADSTIYTDRRRKGSLYAAGGISDYWLVNLQNQCLEVYRDPQPNPIAEYGYAYASLTTLRATDQIAPLAGPNITIKVAELLGPILPDTSRRPGV